MLYRDGQALLIAFLLPLIFVFAFWLYDLEIVLSDSPALAGNDQGAARYFEFALPGLLAMGIMNFAVFTVAVALTTYRDQQVLARISVTPMSPSSFLAGQIFSRVSVTLLQVGVVLGAAYLLGLRFGANALWLFFFAIPGSLIFLNIGFMLAGWSRSIAAATGMANLIVLPLAFLSGVFLPISALPEILRETVIYLPLTPLVDMMRSEFMDVPMDGDPITGALVLVGWMAGTTVLAALSFRSMARR
jgi:ABC-2 type transport system permease protein